MKIFLMHENAIPPATMKIAHVIHERRIELEAAIVSDHVYVDAENKGKLMYHCTSLFAYCMLAHSIVYLCNMLILVCTLGWGSGGGGY